ncbi:MAG: hypothetical protein MZV70_67235 [Desulfobacterales bacterium]|nr:hypothetical protein [Desulfobacterales bacterium]
MARFLWALARREDALVAPRVRRHPRGPAGRRASDYLLLLVTTLDRLIMGLRPFRAPSGRAAEAHGGQRPAAGTCCGACRF